MGCFSTPKCAEKTSGVPRYSSRTVARDSNLSLLSNKPVELPDPRSLLEGTRKSGNLKRAEEEPVASVSVSDHSKGRELPNRRTGRRAAFSGPLVYNNVAMTDSSRASTNYFSSDDARRTGTGLRLRRASSFGGRPQPLPLPADAKTTPSPEGKQIYLPLPAPEDATSRARARTSRTTSSFKLEAVDDGPDTGSRFARRGRQASSGGLPLPPPSVASKLMASLPAFEFRDLMFATDDFAESSCLERGAFGSVFSARLKDPSSENNSYDAKIDATVLRLPENPGQGCLEWRSEVQLLAQIACPNVCVVKGYCSHEAGPRLSTGERRQERLLVFEQPYNGPFSDHLFGNRYLTYLDWRMRIDIALGAARGLLYIHDRAPLQIVYPDFCTSNVLLDRDFSAMLAGYGLSVIATPSSFKPSMSLSQTHAKNNVWSFGVFLLELLTGKNSRDTDSFGDDEDFLQWGRQYFKDEAKLAQVIDPRMRELCPITGAIEVVDLLLQCTSKRESLRPPMSEIVSSLVAIQGKYCSTIPGASRMKNKGPARWILSPRRAEPPRDFHSSSDLQSSSDASSSSEVEDMFTSRISPRPLRVVD